MCHVLSCQFVLTPPILLPVYWLICPTCLPSLPSSFAPSKISLCLQFRCWFVALCHTTCVLSCPILSCPALHCLPVCFSPTGLFCLLLLLLIKSLFSSCNWVLALFPLPVSDITNVDIHTNLFNHTIHYTMLYC